MLKERYGPIGNERYRGYLSDVRLSAKSVAAFLADILELSKSGAAGTTGELGNVDLNEVVRRCVADVQLQTRRERILIRTALAQHLPAIIADANSANQIVNNLLSGLLKLAPAGGQVIVSTAALSSAKVVLRLRDTGRGLSASGDAASVAAYQLSAAVAPSQFQDAELRFSIARAIAEAGGATMTRSDRSDDGMLVEVVFPATQTS